MWYNRIVMDENNNEILREKCFVSEVYELYNGLVSSNIYYFRLEHEYNEP